MRKIILTLMALIWMTGGAFAAVNPNMVIGTNASGDSYSLRQPTVAVLVDINGSIKAYPEAADGIAEKISEGIAPKRISLLNRYKVVRGNDVITNLNDYLEENNLPNAQNMKKGDLTDFGRKYGYDYVLLLSFSQNADYKTSNYVLVAGSSVYVLSADLVAKLVDVESGAYLYRKNITQKADSTAMYSPVVPVWGSPSKSNAWRALAEKCIEVFLTDMNNEILLKLK